MLHVEFLNKFFITFAFSSDLIFTNRVVEIIAKSSVRGLSCVCSSLTCNINKVINLIMFYKLSLLSNSEYFGMGSFRFVCDKNRTG